MSLKHGFFSGAEQKTFLRNSFRRRQEEKQALEDEQTLFSIAQKVDNQLTLYKLSRELGVSRICVEKRLANQQIEIAAFDVLFKDWYRTEYGFLYRGGDKQKKLENAVTKAGLAGCVLDGVYTHEPNASLQ